MSGWKLQSFTDPDGADQVLEGCSKLEEIYGGSYMIVNGERVDNLRKIQAQIAGTLDDALKIEALVASSQPMDVEQSVLSEIEDVEMREEIRRMLNE